MIVLAYTIAHLIINIHDTIIQSLIDKNLNNNVFINVTSLDDVIDYNISNIGHYIIGVCVCVYPHLYGIYKNGLQWSYIFFFFKTKTKKIKKLTTFTMLPITKLTCPAS